MAEHEDDIEDMSKQDEEQSTQEGIDGELTKTNPDRDLDDLERFNQAISNLTPIFQVLQDWEPPAVSIVNNAINQQRGMTHLAMAVNDLPTVNQIIAKSINPAIFEIAKAANQPAIEEMYSVVAAARIAETPIEPVEPEEANTTSADIVESTFYDLIATYFSNASGSIPEGVKNRSRAIQESETLQSKRESFTELVRQADEKTRLLLEMVINLSIWIIFLLLLGGGQREHK